MATDAPALEGAFRSPRNLAAEVKGSIHDDATASKLGFKGGTVAGSIHMDQFAPLLVEAFGERWFETGDISLYFTQATTDGEAVRAVVEPGEDRARLSMFNEAGDLICKGTASIRAPDAGSDLIKRFREQEPAAEGRLRILAEMRVGDEHRDLPLRISRESLNRSLETITENLPAYADGGVLPPSHAVRLAHLTRGTVMGRSAQPHVGLFGGLEVRHFKGPLRADVDYVGRTRILKFTESPRTENVWYEVTFADPATGADVGQVLYLLRIMKNSSPLWAEAAA